LFHIKMIFA